MDDKLVLYEEHYERVVNHIINQYQYYLISYQDYLEGFNLFTLGSSMGYKYPVSILKNFLEIARVKTKNNKELQVVFKIRNRLQHIN